MPIVSTDFLAGVRTAFMAVFDQVMGTVPSQWQAITTTVEAGNKAIMQFNWLGSPPMPRQQIGTLEFGKAFPHDYQVEVTDYGVGVKVDINELRRDGVGTIALFLRAFFEQTAKFKDKLVFGALNDGFTTLCFTGAEFFDDSHSYGDGQTLDNKFALALSDTNYNAAWATINTATDDSGEPLAHVPTHLAAPSLERKTVLELLKAERLSSGATNVFIGDVDPVISPYITDTNSWFLLAAGGALKPIILVMDQDFEFVANDGLTAESVMHNNKAEYAVKGNMVVGYGDPRMAVGSSGAS